MTWRGRKLLCAIVEGHGEQTAVPVLLRRWFKQVGAYDWITEDKAIRASGAGALKRPHSSDDETGVEYYLEIGLAKGADAILVVLDADDECRERVARRQPPFGPELLERARKHVGERAVSVAVVVADREYEAWFLSMREILRAAGAVAREWTPLRQVEDIRNCKREMNRLLGRAYEPSVDQAPLTWALPLDPAEPALPRSYRKLLKELARLVPPPEGST
jgi:hypothetical protein